MSEINKLPTQVINQIAAGEVVERPASVLKELMENAIDAGATVIDVVVEQGGLEKIEVRDNGKGIDSSDLPNAFERYATSKLSTLDDLQSLLSYGFRGEALAAIGSVSTTTITSKRGDTAYTISTTNDTISSLTPASRAQGTTVTVEKLFDTVPARQKFLKAADTEYRYVLEVFNYFALLNGKIHFSLTHNSKGIYVFPVTNDEYFPVERVATIYKMDKSLLLPISYEEYGMSFRGVLVHPKALSNSSKVFSTYVNKRPINDRGLFKSMQQGITGFVPDNYKVAGVMAIFVPPDQVDVNVHPRKMEVKFINPFRVYAAVTHAVKMCLEANVSAPDRQIVTATQHLETSVRTPTYSSNNSPRSFTSNWDRKSDIAYDRLRTAQTQFLSDAGSSTANDAPYFQPAPESDKHIPEYVLSQSQLHLADAEVMPVLGRYILVAFMDELWIVDQHAAAERVRYEQFRKAYLEGLQITQQVLLTPITMFVTEQDSVVLAKNITVFSRLGFTVEFIESKKQLIVSAVPVSLQNADIQRLIQDTVSEMSDHFDTFVEPTIGMYATEHDLSLVIATMACHNSVRMNQRISVIEAKSIVKNLLECEIPFACPHGRKAIWRLQKEDIDKEFMRT